MMLVLTEKAFMAQVVAYARLRGWEVFHTHDSRRSAPGFPDLAMARTRYDVNKESLASARRGDRFILAEIKREEGELSPSQRRWMEMLRRVADASGGAVGAYVWRPSGWPEIERTLA